VLVSSQVLVEKLALLGLRENASKREIEDAQKFFQNVWDNHSFRQRRALVQRAAKKCEEYRDAADLLITYAADSAVDRS
jgi:acyl-CoA reductase-like NAD-dependent aldehyde dehydrogenase